MELSFAVRQAIRRDEPICVDDLTLYPIRVAEYEAFCAARPGVEVLQRTFPVRLLSVPLLGAMYRMDYDAVTAGEAPVGLFFRALLFLALALRLGEGEEAAERVKRFQVVADPKDPGRLKCVRWLADGTEPMEVTPVQFARLRPILAAQNGITLESDDANPELVQAERDLAAAKGVALDVNLGDLIATVAALSGAEETDVEDWTIRRLDARKRALDRAMRFLICGIGESQGTKWKGGNPYPSPFYDRTEEESGALISLDQFHNGRGMAAVANPSATGPDLAGGEGL